MKFSRRCNHSPRVRGFTVLELLVALAVLATVTAVSWPFADGLRRFYQNSKSRANMADYRGAWEAWLSQNMIAATESAWSPTAAMPAGVIDLGNGYASLGRPTSLASSVRDGFNNDLRVLLSPVRSKPWTSGVTAYYRDIYIVSGGNDGVVNSGFVTDVASGSVTFNLASDDLVEVVYGERALDKFLAGANGKLQAVSDAFQRYYLSRRNGDPATDERRDYFHSCATWSTSDQQYCDPATTGSWGFVADWYVLSPNETVVAGQPKRFELLGLKANDLSFGDAVGISVSTGHSNSAFARAGPWFNSPYSVALRMAGPATSTCRGTTVQGALCRDVYAPQ